MRTWKQLAHIPSFVSLTLLACKCFVIEWNMVKAFQFQWKWQQCALYCEGVCFSAKYQSGYIITHKWVHIMFYTKCIPCNYIIIIINYYYWCEFLDECCSRDYRQSCNVGWVVIPGKMGCDQCETWMAFLCARTEVDGKRKNCHSKLRIPKK